MTLRYSTDIVIFGGGVAGLWLLNALRSAGYQAILFEKESLGGAQTMASQGIIHGGLKYALQGALSSATQAIADMPSRWRACLDGSGELDWGEFIPFVQERQEELDCERVYKTFNYFDSKNRGLIDSKMLIAMVEEFAKNLTRCTSEIH